MSCCSCEGTRQQAVEHVSQEGLEALQEQEALEEPTPMEISIDLTEMPQARFLPFSCTWRITCPDLRA